MNKIIAALNEATIDTSIDVVDENIEALCKPWPQLPKETHYGISGEIIDLATKNSEVDPAALLLTTLTWFGASVGSAPHINIGDTQHPPRLFSILVGATSRARKGTSEKPIRRIFNLAEKEAGLTPLNVSPGPLSTGEGLIFAIRDPDENNLIETNAQDKRILCVESEFGSVLRMGKRDGNILSCIIRLAWDSGDIRPLTKTNRISVTNAHINILGHITHHELIELFGSTDTWNGFANRFLWGCVRRPKHVALPQAMPENAVASIAKILGDILKFSQRVSEVPLTPEATEMWESEYTLLSNDPPGRLGAVTSRAEAQTLRIALIYALLDGKNKIDVIHLKAAISLWQFCYSSAEFLFGSSSIDDPNIKKIIDALCDGPKTTTEINGLFSGHLTGNKLNNLLTTLQLTGKVNNKTQGGGQGKGKAATFWMLNDS